MERHRVGIVIPALNEAGTVAAIVSGAIQYGLPIVVDDGSSDETGALAEASGAVVVRIETTAGYDEALNSGFLRAEQLGCKYVITLDADGQHDPGILGQFIQMLDEGADLVVGVRDRYQRISEYVFSWIALRKWGIQDPLCGLKAYKLDLYRELGHFDSYSSVGTELAIHAARNLKSIAQVAVRTRNRMGASRFGGISANKKILRALFIGALS